MVFYQAIRMQHIGAYLRAKIDIELGIFQLLADRTLLLQFVFVEFGPEHLHRALSVFVLRALILAGNHYPGGNMGDAYRRICGVDMLSALATGTVRIHPQVFLLDIDLDRLVNFRGDEDAGKRSMPALGLVEG